MMLNGAVGLDRRPAAGAAPAGASQASSDVPGAPPSSAMQRAVARRRAERVGAAHRRTAAARCASREHRREALPASTDGASGATATPARSAPRNIAAYVGEVARRSRSTSPGRDAVALQRRRDAVHQRIECRRSSSVSSPCTSARCAGRACACSRIALGDRLERSERRRRRAVHRCRYFAARPSRSIRALSLTKVSRAHLA